MDRSVIANLRLSNQLLRSENLKTPQEIVSWMGAVQAQDFNMSKWALGVRSSALSSKIVEDAVRKGEIVRTHILRPTWHLVAGTDIHWMLGLSSPRLEPIMKSYTKTVGLTDSIRLRAADIVEQVLSDGVDLTRPQLGEVLKSRGVELDSRQLTHLMFSAELQGLVCSGEVKNNKQTYCLLEDRIPKIEQFDKQVALERLARKYFTSHAPATLQDFVWWSGLATVEARCAMEMIKSDFIIEKIDGQQYWINNSFVGTIENQDSVLLLPAWDEFVVSYKDRQHIVTDEHYRKVISTNGIFKPVVVKNGQIIGMWKRIKKKNNVLAETQLFDEVNTSVREAIEKEARLFEQFHI